MKKLAYKGVALTFGVCLVSALMLLSACKDEKTETPQNKSYTVKIAQMQFTPNSLTVNKGDTVVWVNEDYVQHDITDVKDKAWSSGPLDKGMKWSKVITKDEDYFCSIHVVMKGTIRVNK
jgi:plastocyanin